MTVIDQLACQQGRRDEVPNQELARKLAESRDCEGIQEIAANLWNKDPDVQSDCIKVLYETGYLDPELIADYYPEFLKLLRSRSNRLVWGGMLALSTIAGLRPSEIDAQRPLILKTMETGSVITVDNGVKILAVLASKLPGQNPEIFPLLLEHLKTCRPKEVPQHAEKTLMAVNTSNQAEFIQVLEQRMPDLAGGQVTRIQKVIKDARSR